MDKNNQINFIEDDSSQYVINTSLVTVDMVELVRDGKLIGNLTGVFDFNKIPPDYHGTCLQWLMQNRTRLYLPNSFSIDSKKPEDKRPWWKLFG